MSRVSFPLLPNKVFLAVVLIGTAYGQSGLRMFGGLPSRDLALTGSTLRITFANVSASQDWALGVAVDPSGATPQLVMAGASLGPRDEVNNRKLNTLTPLVPAQYSIQPGQVSLDLGSLGASGALVYAIVPTGTEVVCEANGSVVADTRVTNSLLIRSGLLVNRSMVGLSSVIGALTIPPAPPSAAFTTMRDGTVVVSTTEARAHLLSKPFPATMEAAATDRHVFLVIAIGVDGAVNDVKLGSGDAALAAAVTNAVKSWKFTPFLQNGQAIAVKTVASFTATQSGRIISIFP
jgi:hypothetical protein